MPCDELVRNRISETRFQSSRFSMLHPDGRRLVAHWFDIASKKRNVDPAESFEPFIYTWIAFNGWAACCTELDQDRQMIEALTASRELVQRFGELLQQSVHFRETTELFRSYWPVFKVQELKRLGALRWSERDRQATIDHYFDKGAQQFAPACYQRHIQNGEEIPLDWPHVLGAIYQVRCNLFHGDKAPHSEIDRVLVHSAFQILVHFLDHCGYMVR